MENIKPQVLLRSGVKYHNLMLNLVAAVLQIDKTKLSFIDPQFGDFIQIEGEDGELDEDEIYHWGDLCLLILNRLSATDKDIQEFGHCLMQSIIPNYDPDEKTLHPEQYLIKMFNNLPANISAGRKLIAS